jgi:hypothetical protein
MYSTAKMGILFESANFCGKFFEVIDLLGKSINRFAHGRNARGRHVKSAGCLIFHTVTV